ncbi:MAG: N-acyl homoserine lactonase family protein, partial [Actinomycetota bacterium]
LALALAELQLPEDERSRWPEGAPFPIVATRCRTATGCSCSTRGSARGTRRSTSSCGRWPIEGALAAHGIAMADVTAVANCHLHADHGGQNFLFPGRPIFAQRREWAMVHEPDYTVAEWVDAPGLAYELLDGEVEVAPGLRLIPTPGHAPGHQSLVVETPEGTVLIAGQAILTMAEWDGSTDERRSGEPPEGDERREAYVASATRLRTIDPVRVHFVHDPSVWERGG